MIREVVNEQTGEITAEWGEEVSYKYPKPQPEFLFIRDLAELKKHCSDSSRTLRGDTGYLLDFLFLGLLEDSEMRVMLSICRDTEVHNYSCTTIEIITKRSGVHRKTVLRAIRTLEKKNLLKKIREDFDYEGVTMILFEVSPNVSFKGSYYKHIIKCRKHGRYDGSLEGHTGIQRV